MNDNQVKEVIIHGRWRVVLISVLASGITALMISWTTEAQIYNAQAERARDNCQKIQNGFSAVTEIATDVSILSRDSKVRMKWREYANKFDDIIPPQANTCVEQFPKRTIIPFVGG